MSTGPSYNPSNDSHLDLEKAIASLTSVVEEQRTKEARAPLHEAYGKQVATANRDRAMNQAVKGSAMAMADRINRDMLDAVKMAANKRRSI